MVESFMRRESLCGLHWFSVVLVFCTIILISVGAFVTSKGAGLAVPDWPQSYGYNMFLFPISRWVGPILYEHSHRLIASGVGFMTIILAGWIWMRDSRCWMKGLGVAALVLVIIQGLLGGYRVVWLKDWLGLIHGCTAQLYFGMILAIALFTSPSWLNRRRVPAMSRGWVFLVGILTLLIYGQLILGAAMRHAHRGLSIPDFPKAYGAWWPKIDVKQLEEINRVREIQGQMPTTLGLIHLQMMHRILAAILLVGILAVAWKTSLLAEIPSLLRRGTQGWGAAVLLQAVLGVATIWTQKAADIATLHVAVGALVLGTGVILVIVGGAAAGIWSPEENSGC